MLTGEHISDCDIVDGTKSMKMQEQTNAINLTNMYLGDNYPDPFNNETTIPFKLQEETNGIIVIKDILGKTVSTYKVNYTEDKVILNTKDWEKGMYFYSLIIDNELLFTKKMILTR